jgi:hypothetical protein
MQHFVPLQMLESRLLLTQFPATGQWEIYSVQKTLPLPLGKVGAYVFNAVHNYLVLTDTKGNDKVEIHGIYSQSFFTLGYTLSGNYLQVALYKADGYMADQTVLSYKPVVGGTQTTITNEFLNAYNVTAKALNNTHDLYEAASLLSSSNTYNSNSVWLTEMNTLVTNPYKFEGPYRGPGDTIDLTKAPTNNPAFGNPTKDPYVNLPLKTSLSFTDVNASQNPDNGFIIAEDDEGDHNPWTNQQLAFNGSDQELYDLINYDNGTSKKQSFSFAALPSGVTSEWMDYSSANATGTLNEQILNWTAGGSQERIFTGLVSAVSSEDFNYSGANATGTLNNQVLNWTAGGSQEQLLTGLPSGVASEYVNYTGANASGTDTANIFNWTAGGSEKRLHTGLPTGVMREDLDYSGANATGTLNDKILDWTAGGSHEQLLTGLATGVAHEYLDYSGAIATGTLNDKILDWTAGGSQEWYFTGLPAGASQMYQNSNPNDPQPFTMESTNYTMINWTGGGSRKRVMADPMEHYNNFRMYYDYDYSGANGTGTLNDVIDNTNYYFGTSYGSIEYVYSEPGGPASKILAYSGFDGTGTLLS